MKTIFFPCTPITLLLLVACSGTASDKNDSNGHGDSDTDTGEVFDLSRTQTTDGGTFVVSYQPSPDPIPLQVEGFDYYIPSRIERQDTQS